VVVSDCPGLSKDVALVVNPRDGGQNAAECRFELVWPGTGTVLVRSTMDAVVDVRGTQVRIDLEAHEGAQRVARRQWTESFPSQIAHSLGFSGA